MLKSFISTKPSTKCGYSNGVVGVDGIGWVDGDLSKWGNHGIGHHPDNSKKCFWMPSEYEVKLNFMLVTASHI